MTTSTVTTNANTRSRSLADSLKVGLGQLVVSSDPTDVLVAVGLGSCIGLVMADTSRKVAGMVHVMLPDSALHTSGQMLHGKYADTAIPALLDAVLRLGADRNRLVIKMAGGSQMFSSGSGAGVLNIGTRNAVAVRESLSKAGLKLQAAQTGGSVGRTLDVTVGTGVVTVRAVGGAAQPL